MPLIRKHDGGGFNALKLLFKIISPTILVVLSGCGEAKLKVSATSKEDGGSGSSFKVTGRAPLVVKSGDKLSLTGEGFKPGMSLALAGNAVGNVEVSDAQNASWTAPEGMSGGVMRLTATQDGATQDISIIYQPGDGSIPVITKTAAEVCSPEQFYDAQGTLQTGSKNCGAYQGNMMSTAHRTVDRDQVSLATEVSTGLSGDYRSVPDIRLDDDGYDGTSPVVKQARPESNCGTTGTIEERIADCNVTWSGKANGTSGEGDWKLVTRIDSPAVYEVWRDERTGLIWSDRVGDSSSPIDVDSNDFTANWCQASGNAQADDPSDYCNDATYQNQVTPESWCGDEARGAPMKGNIGSTQNITWRLPTKYDWQIADANGIRFVLPNMVYFFWSASVVSVNRDNAWLFYGGYGDYDFGGCRFCDNAVRCVGAR